MERGEKPEQARPALDTKKKGGSGGKELQRSQKVERAKRQATRGARSWGKHACSKRGYPFVVEEIGRKIRPLETGLNKVAAPSLDLPVPLGIEWGPQNGANRLGVRQRHTDVRRRLKKKSCFLRITVQITPGSRGETRDAVPRVAPQSKAVAFQNCKIHIS